MELIDGEPLRAYAGDGADPDRVAWSGSVVARALDAAHRRGPVHRDIKPGNVMIRADGVVKVLDSDRQTPLRKAIRTPQPKGRRDDDR